MAAETGGDGLPTILIVGASRGLGLAFAAEYLARGWSVIGTVRGEGRTALHDLAAANPGRVAVEPVEIDDGDAIDRLAARLGTRRLDTLLVNAGTTTRDEHVAIGTVSTDEFVRVMVTNTLGPMRIVDRLGDRIPADGLVAVMSSGQGSIANNETGRREVYRSSKAALNMTMRSVSARRPELAMLLLAPGWIRTDLGGPDAPYTIEESVPRLTDLLLAGRGQAGLRYLDRDGRTVPW